MQTSPPLSSYSCPTLLSNKSLIAGSAAGAQTDFFFFFYQIPCLRQVPSCHTPASQRPLDHFPSYWTQWIQQTPVPYKSDFQVPRNSLLSEWRVSKSERFPSRTTDRYTKPLANPSHTQKDQFHSWRVFGHYWCDIYKRVEEGSFHVQELGAKEEVIATTTLTFLPPLSVSKPSAWGREARARGSQRKTHLLGEGVQAEPKGRQPYPRQSAGKLQVPRSRAAWQQNCVAALQGCRPRPGHAPTRRRSLLRPTPAPVPAPSGCSCPAVLLLLLLSPVAAAGTGRSAGLEVSSPSTAGESSDWGEENQGRPDDMDSGRGNDREWEPQDPLQGKWKVPIQGSRMGRKLTLKPVSSPARSGPSTTTAWVV